MAIYKIYYPNSKDIFCSVSFFIFFSFINLAISNYIFFRISFILINTSSSFNLDEDDFLEECISGVCYLFCSSAYFFKFYKRMFFNISKPSNYIIFWVCTLTSYSLKFLWRESYILERISTTYFFLFSLKNDEPSLGKFKSS